MDKADQHYTHPARNARWGPWRLLPEPQVEPRRTKLLFLHGFASSPRELRPLGLSLCHHGFEVMAPLLPGHGEYYAGMDSCRPEDWLDAVRLSFQALHRDGSPVAVVGYCLGGALALATARELNPRALALIATPIAPLEEGLFSPAVGDENSDYELFDTTNFVADCRSQIAGRWRRESCHRTVSRRFIDSYNDTIVRAASELSLLRCPTLAVFGEADRVVTDQQRQRLESSVDDKLLQVEIIANAGHSLPIDDGRRQVIAAVTDFLVSVEKNQLSTF